MRLRASPQPFKGFSVSPILSSFPLGPRPARSLGFVQRSVSQKIERQAQHPPSQACPGDEQPAPVSHRVWESIES